MKIPSVNGVGRLDQLKVGEVDASLIVDFTEEVFEARMGSRTLGGVMAMRMPDRG